MKDLEVLKYITVFRIPPEIYAQIDAILEQIITKKKRRAEDRATRTAG